MLTPEQERTRDRFEELIALMAPALDFVLRVGDRISRRKETDTRPEQFQIRAPEGTPD